MNLEKSMCASDNAKNQYLMSILFRLSGGPALKTGMILSWKSLFGFTSRNIVLSSEI